MTAAGAGGARDRWPVELAAVRDRLDQRFRAVAFGSWAGARLVDWGPGWATVRAVPGEQHANLVGTAHGGLVSGLADLAFEVACNSYGRVVVAVSLDGHFAAPAALGEPLVADAVEVSRSRRMASYRIEVAGGAGLVGWFQAVAYRTDRWHVAEDDLPAAWREQH